MTEQVGFIGIGGMGGAMASHVHDYLVTQGSALHIYNRTADKCEFLASRGAKVAKTIQELASSCDIIMSCLSNDQVVEDVFNEVVPVLSKKSQTKKSIYLDTSTILPATTKRLAEKALQQGVIFITSPIFGRPEAAKNKLLVSIPSGPKEYVERIHPYVSAYSRAVVNMGEVVGASNAMKLSGNFMIASIIDLLGQAMTLAEKNGVSRDVCYKTLELLFPSPVILGYAKRLATDDLTCPEGGGFTTTLGMKDVSHIRTLAQQSECPVPFADIVFQHLLTLRAQGNADLDWTAIGAVNRVAAGLELREHKDKD